MIEEQKKSQENISSLNAGGDDRNLAEHGDNAHYWYSINDMMTLLIHSRRENLVYNNQVQPGEEYIAIRQNQSRVFLADPYHSANFSYYLADDVSRITGNHNEGAQNNHAWQGNMPNLIVIPLLSGMHWRTIAIQINYETNTLNITWDDPYGNFPQVLRDQLLQPIRASASNLINRHNQINNLEVDELDEWNINVVHHENDIDQLGRGNNGWDCGPITLTNIRDYVTHYAQNQNLDGVNYTIVDNTEDNHTANIRNARINHIEEYGQVAELPIDQNRLTKIRFAWEQDKENKLKAIDLKLYNKILSLDPFYLDMFFSISENYKQFILEVDEQEAIQYTLSFIQQERNREIIKIISQISNSKQQIDISQLNFAFNLPTSWKKFNADIINNYKILFNIKEDIEISNIRIYNKFKDEVRDKSLMNIYNLINSSVDDFKQDLSEIISENHEALAEKIDLYVSGFLARNKKKLGQKKSQDELLQMFLSQNLEELGLNPQFKIKKLADKGHANDVYLVSNTEINQDDPITIDYYAKTFSKDLRHTEDGLIDPREALLYKVLEYMKFGPECHFFIKSGSSSLGTISGGNFIVTRNVITEEGLSFLLDTEKNQEQFAKLYTDNKDKFAIEVSAAALLKDILVLHDTFNSNVINYGVLYDENNDDFRFQFIDHLPNANNGIFDSMKKKKADINNYSPRKELYDIIDKR